MPAVSRLESLEPRRLLASVGPGFVDSAFGPAIDGGTAMAFAPDGRLFVLSQGGAIRIVSPDGSRATTAVTLRTNPHSERGLIGVAVSPDFADDGHLFVYYTELPDGESPDYAGPTRNRVSRLTVRGDAIDAASERVILRLEELDAGNHNGGGMAFGRDGKLYVGVGENAVRRNAQDRTNRLGKLLRINRDGSIPADNPTSIRGLGTTAGDDRAIYSAGLRNPYTLAVDPRAGTILINDVGSRSFEEVDRAAPGANFGWGDTEGYFDSGDDANADFTNPLYSYARGNGPTTGRAIAGGAFYRSDAATGFGDAYDGDYFFGDFSAGWVNVIDPDAPPGLNGATPFVTGAPGVVDVEVGPDGALYYLQRDIGADDGYSGVRRVAAAPRPRVDLTRAGSLYVTGTAGDDEVVVNRLGGRLRVLSNGVASLLVPGEVKRIRIAAGGGDDTIRIGANVRAITADGGPGDDLLAGGNGDDTLYGGAGRDTLLGSRGDDRLLGGPGIDRHDGGPGRDRADEDARERRVSVEVLT